jgi:hypothetical protein
MPAPTHLWCALRAATDSGVRSTYSDGSTEGSVGPAESGGDGGPTLGPGQFACGNGACDIETEFCGTPPQTTSACVQVGCPGMCIPLPKACDASSACACMEALVCTPMFGGNCSGSATTGLAVSCND